MNAVLLGAHEATTPSGSTLIGIRDAFDGLAAGRTTTLDPAELKARAGEAGTLLGTSRATDLRRDVDVQRCRDGIDQLGLDGLIVAGGSGSQQAVGRLRATTNIPIAYVPTTIDNDVQGTEWTIGFDSAVNYALAAIDRLRLSAASMPGRAFIVETLGGDSGAIATAVGRTTPVDAVLVPETPIPDDVVARVVREAVDRDYAIVVMCEGIGSAADVARRIGELAGIRMRISVLGHGQRAAEPTALDRRLGREAGHAAVEALLTWSGIDVRFSRLGQRLRDS